MITLITIAGCILVVLAAAHATFPRYFGWRDELSALSLLTRQIFYIHHFFIALTVGMMGFLCVLYGEDLLSSALGRVVSFGLCLFWFVRLLFQFFVYSPSLWRGKRFETSMHILFSVLWIYLTTVFLFAGLAYRPMPTHTPPASTPISH
jgi:hypothetical protein